MKKRFISSLLAVAIVLGSLASLSPVLAIEKTGVELSDIEGHWGESEIKKALEKGYVLGYKDATFRPNNNLIRAEMATILADVFELKDYGAVDHFADLLPHHWYFEAVSKVFTAEIMFGVDWRFLPEKEITREEAFATLARALELEGEELKVDFPDQDEISSWFIKDGEVAALLNLGFIQGNNKGELEPKKTITRAEMVKIMNSALEYRLENGSDDELEKPEEKPEQPTISEPTISKPDREVTQEEIDNGFVVPELMVNLHNDGRNSYFAIILDNFADYDDTDSIFDLRLKNWDEFVEYRVKDVFGDGKGDTPYHMDSQFLNRKGEDVSRGNLYTLHNNFFAYKHITEDRPLKKPEDGYLLEFDVSLTMNGITQNYDIKVPFIEK